MQRVLDVPMVADRGGAARRGCGEIGQIVRHLAGAAPQPGLGAAMQDRTVHADDVGDDGLPFGAATTDFARNTSTVLVSCRLRALQTETLLLAGRLAVQAATVSFSRVG